MQGYHSTVWLCLAPGTHPLAGIPRRRRQSPNWSLGTEAALKLYLHCSCLVLAVAMAPVHQPEGKGEHLVQAEPSLSLALCSAIPAGLPPRCATLFPGEDEAEWFEANYLQRCVCMEVLIRGIEGKRECSGSGGLQVLTTFKCFNHAWVRVPRELGQGLCLMR